MASRPTNRGYSLIEMLLVLVILGILMAAVSGSIGDRKGTAVKAVMDQVEATLLAAQRQTVAMGSDVIITTNGKWKTGSLELTYTGAVANTQDAFRSLYKNKAQDHMYAGIDAGDTWYSKLDDTIKLEKLADSGDAAKFPIDLAPSVKDAMAKALFTGGANTITINGYNKRFTTGCYVAVMGLSGSGLTNPKGPIGVVVVPKDSTTVYKFYKREGENTWRRL